VHKGWRVELILEQPHGKKAKGLCYTVGNSFTALLGGLPGAYRRVLQEAPADVKLPDLAEGIEFVLLRAVYQAEA
jgi:hypothetical protein